MCGHPAVRSGRWWRERRTTFGPAPAFTTASMARGWVSSRLPQKGARTFPRLHARAVAWSPAGDRLAVTASGWWSKRLTFQAPDGTEASPR